MLGLGAMGLLESKKRSSHGISPRMFRHERSASVHSLTCFTASALREPNFSKGSFERGGGGLASACIFMLHVQPRKGPDEILNGGAISQCRAQFLAGQGQQELGFRV